MLCMVAVILLISIPESLCTVVPEKESARYFVGDFAICSIKFFALGVQYRCLVINGNSSQGRFRNYGKILLEKEKQFQEIRWEIQANQVEIK